ncbi:MAG: hypothetical protein EAZ51_02935 [Sphingobacteriales bacterium]|nr:MAG: hypothetical protein EAZ64_07515 [Sphingobacteriales bacterium]TAF82207.1 MAG: hypothetical protein EAZ51_02935 [Sphingobacteriales bacterium]
MKNPYYQSHQKLPFIAHAGQQKINTAKVLVVGAGGLGCPCLQALAGAGVGNLAVADFDTISLSNLHRQQLYSFNDIGNQKAITAVNHLRKLNPFIEIQWHQILVDEQNILELLKPYDIIVDATDNFETRYLINDACVVLNKPLVYGAIHKTEGHFTVFNYNGSATLRCLFPETESQNTLQSCADIGAYNITTSLIGNFMAGEVLKIILENHEVASNKLVCINALSATSNTFLYTLNLSNRVKSSKKFTLKSAQSELTPLEIIARAKNQKIRLFDVRTLVEREVFNIGGAHFILDDFIKNNTLTFSSSSFYIFYCQKGLRSKKAVSFCKKIGIYNCFSLKNGLNWDKNLLDKLRML